MLKRIIVFVGIIICSTFLLLSCTNRSSNSSEPESYTPTISISSIDNMVNFFATDPIIIKAQISDKDGIDDIEKVVFYLNGLSYDFYKSSFENVTDSAAVVSFTIDDNLTLDSYQVYAKVYDFSKNNSSSSDLNLKIVEGSDFEDFSISKIGYKSIDALIEEYDKWYFFKSNIQFNFSRSTDKSLWNGFSYANLNYDPNGDELSNYYRPFLADTVNVSNQYLCVSAVDVAVDVDKTPDLQFAINGGVTPLSIKINTSDHTGKLIENGGNDFTSFANLPDQADSLCIIFSSYDINNHKIGSTEFLLADYTFDESYKDYTVNKWTKIDLSSLGNNVKSIKIEVISSRDNSDNASGILNYFVLDDFKVENVE